MSDWDGQNKNVNIQIEFSVLHKHVKSSKIKTDYFVSEQ